MNIDKTLDRFLKAQERDYETALKEIRSGYKRSHWIWYIFPQIEGLGMSHMSEYYGIQDINEAVAYMKNPVLAARLIEISETLLKLDTCDAGKIMGWPDDMKLRSSMTLFLLAAPDVSVFKKVLDKFFGGELDQNTIRIIEEQKAGKQEHGTQIAPTQIVKGQMAVQILREANQKTSQEARDGAQKLAHIFDGMMKK